MRTVMSFIINMLFACCIYFHVPYLDVMVYILIYFAIGAVLLLAVILFNLSTQSLEKVIKPVTPKVNSLNTSMIIISPLAVTLFLVGSYTTLVLYVGTIILASYIMHKIVQFQKSYLNNELKQLT